MYKRGCKHSKKFIVVNGGAKDEKKSKVSIDEFCETVIENLGSQFLIRDAVVGKFAQILPSGFSLDPIKFQEVVKKDLLDQIKAKILEVVKEEKVCWIDTEKPKQELLEVSIDLIQNKAFEFVEHRRRFITGVEHVASGIIGNDEIFESFEKFLERIAASQTISKQINDNPLLDRENFEINTQIRKISIEYILSLKFSNDNEDWFNFKAKNDWVNSLEKTDVSTERKANNPNFDQIIAINEYFTLECLRKSTDKIISEFHTEFKEHDLGRPFPYSALERGLKKATIDFQKEYILKYMKNLYNFSINYFNNPICLDIIEETILSQNIQINRSLMKKRRAVRDLLE